jgi:hypothetical protein
MPVTAKLSKLFYDRLGEQVANELVDWFNAVDATYRGDLRELNELNYARFDAKLEQRLAELEARLEMRLGRRIDALELKLDSKLDRSVAEHAFAQLDGRIERVATEMRAALAEGLRKQMGWIFFAWASLLAALIPLYLKP